MKGKLEASGCKCFYYFKCNDHSALQGVKIRADIVNTGRSINRIKAQTRKGQTQTRKVGKWKTSISKTEIATNGAVYFMYAFIGL